jgi:putative MATE family efflux protein
MIDTHDNMHIQVNQSPKVEFMQAVQQIAVPDVPAAKPAVHAAKAGMRRSIERGPIVPTMLRLALPTVSVLVVQTLVSVAETFYVSFLGTTAIAGVSLVFPVVMLMTMMSNGGIGGGVSSAVAREIGAGRQKEANALLLHAIVLAFVFGLLFTAGALTFGPDLYRSLGGRGAILTAALTYSAFLFAGAVPIWLVNLISSALRGAGDVKVPALVTFLGAAILIPLSPAFIFGFGPLPRMGVAGAGIAVCTYYVVAGIALVAYLASGRATLLLRIAPLEGRLFRLILGVGLLAAVGTLQTNVTVVLLTGAAGSFGTAALAGYGIASRLDYLLVPLLFGIGAAVLTMVGSNVGAGHAARARHIAWIGAAAGFLLTGIIGATAALFPAAWLGIFTHDPAVTATGTLYLRIVAPFYALYGAGFILYFASQGAGRVMWPFLAGTARLLVSAGLGWLVVTRFAAGLDTLFGVIAAGSVIYAAVTIAFVALSTKWGRRTIPG